GKRWVSRRDIRAQLGNRAVEEIIRRIGGVAQRIAVQSKAVTLEPFIALEGNRAKFDFDRAGGRRLKAGNRGRYRVTVRHLAKTIEADQVSRRFGRTSKADTQRPPSIQVVVFLVGLDVRRRICPGLARRDEAGDVRERCVCIALARPKRSQYGS